MCVVALDQLNPLSAVETLVQPAHFADGLARAFDGEKIEYCRGHHYRSRIHHQQQSGMVQPIGNHANQILLGIAVGVGKNAVIHPHGQRADIARRHGHLDALIESGNQSSLKPAAACPGNADSLAVNFRAGEQIIHRADAIPYLPSGKIGPGQIGQVPHGRVFAANQVIATLTGCRIPELAALTLPDGIPGNDDIPPPRQPLTQRLIVEFSIGCMTRRHQHSGMLLGVIIRHVYERCHIYTWQTLENQFFNREPFHLNPAGDARLQVCFCCRQAADHLQKPSSQFVLRL